MKLSILRPCAVITAEDGSTTKRLQAGDQVEFSADWEVKAAQSLINGGMAIEVGGNAEPKEVKKAPAKKSTRKATAKKAD